MVTLSALGWLPLLCPDCGRVIGAAPNGEDVVIRCKKCRDWVRTNTSIGDTRAKSLSVQIILAIEHGHHEDGDRLDLAS